MLITKLEEGSPHTGRHSRAVADLALRVGCSIPGIREAAAVELGFSGMLHDVGKLDPTILGLIQLPRPLTAPEKLRVREHTQEGSKMIAERLRHNNSYGGLISTASFVALHHHDDPDALRGMSDSQSERTETTGLIRAIDLFEALQAPDRPYRAGPAVSSPEEAAAQVMEERAMQPSFGVEAEQLMVTLLQVSSWSIY
jgi:HD-GYP domain-containing protein (c-di-GMP phosphodiesterase class II)